MENIDYFSKYIKYKTKYLKLNKNVLTGGSIPQKNITKQIINKITNKKKISINIKRSNNSNSAPEKAFLNNLTEQDKEIMEKESIYIQSKKNLSENKKTKICKKINELLNKYDINVFSIMTDTDELILVTAIPKKKSYLKELLKSKKIKQDFYDKKINEECDFCNIQTLDGMLKSFNESIIKEKKDDDYILWLCPNISD